MQLFKFLVVLLMLATPGLGRAAAEQYLFVGHRGQARDLGGYPSGPVVFLWWEAQEAELPADVTRVRLTRGVDRLLETDPRNAAQAVLAASAIQGPGGLYDAACTSWRCREQARQLCELEDLEGRGDALVSGSNCGPVRLAQHFRPNVGTKMHDRLVGIVQGTATNATVAWSRIASRQDIALALARKQAFIDIAAPAGVVTYTLDGLGPSGWVRLGEVNVAADPLVVGAPDALEQIPAGEIARCDLPEAGLSHGSVALTWAPPGASAGRASRFLADLVVSGYDVFRRPGACGPIPLPIREPGTGAPRLEGFERRNGAPVMVVPSRGRGLERAQFLEEAPTLEAAGLEPGDEACYVVVPRDVTGAFGAPASVTARVPNRLPPPAPWNVEVLPVPVGEIDGASGEAIRGNDHILLTWDHVDVPNYAQFVRGSLAICNAATATTERRLDLAPTAAGCGQNDEQTMPLDVEGYLVYAFKSLRTATAFADADGDGYSDAIDNGAFGRDVCVAELPPGASLDGFVLPQFVLPDAARKTDAGGLAMRLKLDVLPEAKGEELWYRIASVARGGEVRSGMTPPIRVTFPDDTKPLRPKPEDFVFGTCGRQMSIQTYPVDRGGEAPDVPIAVDTVGNARSLRIVCQGQGEIDWEATGDGAQGVVLQNGDTWIPRGEAGVPGDPVANPLARFLLENSDRVIEEVPLVPVEPRLQIGTLDDGACADVLQNRLMQRLIEERYCAPVLQFIGLGGEVIAESALDPETADLIQSNGTCGFTAYLSPDCEHPIPVQHGGVLEEDPILKLPGLPIDHCADVLEDIDGVLSRIGRVCRPDAAAPAPITLAAPNLGGGLRCQHVVFKSKNNMVSTAHALPCFERVASNIAAPRIIDLDFNASGGPELTWNRPPQRIAGLLLEVYRKAPSLFLSDFIVADNAIRPGERQRSKLSGLGVAPAAGATVTWCVRARAVGLAVSGSGQKLSEPTPLLCRAWSVDPPPPVAYLPWPAIPQPKSLGTDLPARYFENDGVVGIYLGTVDPKLLDPGASTSQYTGITCVDDAGCGAYGVPEACVAGHCVPADCQGPTTCLDTRPLVFGNPNACSAFTKALGAPGRFVVYRQTREASGPGSGVYTYSPLTQVSPRIDGPYCRAQEIPPEYLDLEGSPLPDTNARRNQLARFGRVCNANSLSGPNRCTVFEDPFLRVAHWSAAGGETWPQFSLVYVDEFPYSAGNDVRYQLVYFDERGEIAGYRNTAWVETTP
jgi:hypothetical protein